MNATNAKTLYAVLVGVNDYGGKNLGGCINDVHLISSYLKEYCQRTEIKWNPLYFLAPRAKSELTQFGENLSFEAPTRKSIIEQAFPHFKQAKAGDVCLFYFSGHGSTTVSPAAFAYQRANQRNQTIVLADSRREGGYDLVDKELGYLIYESLLDPTTQQQKEDVHFVAIMDCCFAGDSTRIMDDTRESKERMDIPNPNIPTLVDYYGREHYQVQMINGEERLYVPTAKHVVLAASQHDQSSKEGANQEGYNGVFTYNLVKSLRGGAHHYNYQQLLRRVQLLIPASNPQRPYVDAVLEDSGKYQPFLGGSPRMDTADYFIKYDRKRRRWYLDAGAMHGITASLAGEDNKTILERADLPEGHPNRRVEVTKVFSQLAEVKGNFTDEDKENAPIRVFLTEQALAQTIFAIDPAADKVLVQKLLESQTEFQQSLVYATITEVVNKATFLIHTESDGNYVVAYRDSRIPLFKRTTKARELLVRMERVAKWLAVKELMNINVDRKLSVNSVKLEVQKVEGARFDAETADANHGDLQYDVPISIKDDNDTLPPLEVSYKYDGKGWIRPGIRVAIQLNEPVRKRGLYVSAVYLGSKFGITNRHLPLEHLRIDDKNLARLRIERSQSPNLIYTIPINFDNRYLDLGITEIRDYLKIFISEKPLDTNNFNQPGLELPIKLRESGSYDEDHKSTPHLHSGWRVITLPIIVRRPLESREVFANHTEDFGFLKLSSPVGAVVNLGVSTSVSDQVKKTDRAQRQAQAEEQYLGGSTHGQTSVFTDELEQAGSSHIDTLELTGISPEKVSELRVNPLRIQPGKPLQAGEAILPYTYDADLDLIIPLGFTVEDEAHNNGASQVEVQSLPKPEDETQFIQSDGRDKGVIDSYQVYFRKFVSSRYSKDFDYPRMKRITADEVRNVEMDDLKGAVGKAQKPIAIFVHGLYGDNEYIARTLPSLLHNGHSLISNYDIVLTFDYENLGTQIETSAKALKNKLAEFMPKEEAPPVHLFGYAMGGLVCRYYLEHMDGDKQISDLIMLGTPNKGTIWADIQEYLLTTITGAINTGTFVTNPFIVPITVYLGRFVEKSFTTFQQMQPHSDLIADLGIKAKEQLNTKYHLIAGNTHLIKTDNKSGLGLMQRIVNGLKNKFLLGTLDITLFNSTSNDAFATLESMKDCPYLEEENVYEVPCDLFSYYANSESLAALGRIIKEKVRSS